MKKIYLLGLALAGALAFQACSDSDETSGTRMTGADQIISLTVANGNASETRSGRPLLSSAADQSIENVVVYVVDAEDNSVVATKTFNDWQNESADYRIDDGRYAEFLLEDKLQDGKYKIFAVGYHDESDYGNIEGALVSGNIFQENAVLTLGNDDGAEEIFAGSTDSFAVEQNQGFKKEVVLNRQVAGVYVYANNIPYIEEASQLKLVASDENNQLVLGQFINFDMAENGTGNGITTAVINGMSTKPAFDKTLSTIDLTEWFSVLQDADGDNLIDTGEEYENWRKPARYEGSATFEKGSVFGGAFVIPFAKVGKTQTLKLQLTTASGDVKREWNVNLPKTDSYTLYSWNGSNFGNGVTTIEDPNVYNIVRNHLYGLGTRETDDPGDGSDTKPVPDDGDDPVSLDNKHELDLIVNDNWEIIHDMVLD